MIPTSGQDHQGPADRISLWTATSIAVANMIGTGVFTSLGFQLAEIPSESGFVLLFLWALGGVFALCGALVYGELAAALPRSGGEFNFLGEIFHPLLGFLAGWISFVVGFALPIALAAMAFGSYLHRVDPGIPPTAAACAMVALVTAAHLRDLRLGSVFQNVATVFKLGLIVLFIAAAFFGLERYQPISFAPRSGDLAAIFSQPFAVSLLFVMYAYAGWNASTYINGEVKDPARNVPRSLLLATTLVAVLYVALNAALLIASPTAELRGQLEVGHIAATAIFGDDGGRWMSVLLCVALVSSVSAMTWAGPRVTQMIGEDYSFFKLLSRTNARGIPVVAILVQSGLVIAMLLTASFESLLIYTQFSLAVSSAATVLGVFWLRWRRPDLPRPYRTWLYPWTPALFLALSMVMVFFTWIRHPFESAAGFATVLLGLPVYWLTRPERRTKLV